MSVQRNEKETDASNLSTSEGLARPSSNPAIPQSLLHRLAGPSSSKAGLHRDPSEVSRIIYECSKGSKYFMNEQAKDARMTVQIEQLLKDLEFKLAQKGGNLAVEETEASKLFDTLEKTRIVNQLIVCVDADAFFCSVEEKHDPTLKGKAFGVGSGVLTTASYEARKWGCRSGMAGYIAKKLCPHLIFVKLDFTRYTAASQSIMGILRQFDPNLAPASLDECFMNITPYCNTHSLSPEELTAQMRQKILEETGLSVSAGVGPNAMIAKIAADLNKPNGQFVCPSTKEDSLNFMKSLSVRKVPGIGRVTERWLESLGVKTCGDIWENRGKLFLMRSELGFDLLAKAYLGLGKTDIKPSERESRQSAGCETSFPSTTQKSKFYDVLKSLADELDQDLARLGFSGRTLTLKIKLDTFEVLTRSITPPLRGGRALCCSPDLYHHAVTLLDREIDSRHEAFDKTKRVIGCNGQRDVKIRLLGVKVSHLQDDLNRDEPKDLNNTLKRWVKKGKELAKAGGASAEEQRESLLNCPVCNDHTSIDLQQLNDHVDICLWKTAEDTCPERPFTEPGSPGQKKFKSVLEWCKASNTR